MTGDGQCGDNIRAREQTLNGRPETMAWGGMGTLSK
jgi:hypothetical protein